MVGLFDKISASTKQPIYKIKAEISERLPWLVHPAFKIGRHEGYSGDSFGASAGLIDNTTSKNVLHEVAHAVEITRLPQRIWRRRVKHAQFEMRVKSYNEVLGDRYYEPVTMQATERECRVGGIQLRLLEMGDYDTEGFVEDFVITLKYMADYYMGGSCPLNTHDPADYTDEHKRWIKTRTDLVLQAYNEYTPEVIQQQWSEVMGWLGRGLEKQKPAQGTELVMAI